MTHSALKRPHQFLNYINYVKKETKITECKTES